MWVYFYKNFLWPSLNFFIFPLYSIQWIVYIDPPFLYDIPMYHKTYHESVVQVWHESWIEITFTLFPYKPFRRAKTDGQMDSKLWIHNYGYSYQVMDMLSIITDTQLWIHNYGYQIMDTQLWIPNYGYTQLWIQLYTIIVYLEDH